MKICEHCETPGDDTPDTPPCCSGAEIAKLDATIDNLRAEMERLRSDKYLQRLREEADAQRRAHIGAVQAQDKLRDELALWKEGVDGCTKRVKDLECQLRDIRQWVEDQAGAAFDALDRFPFTHGAKEMEAQERILRHLLKFIDGKVTPSKGSK